MLGNNIDVLVNQLKEVWITYRLSNGAKKSQNCIDFDKLFKQEEVLGVKLSPTKNKEQKNQTMLKVIPILKINPNAIPNINSYTILVSSLIQVSLLGI